MGGNTSAADTSYGTAELPDECEWREAGGVNGTTGICAEKRRWRRRRKAKGPSREEQEEREEEDENEKVEKEMKKEMAHKVHSGPHVDDQPKKTRGKWRRLFTNTFGKLAWRQCQQPYQHIFSDCIGH
ncbi:hypothetical protein TSMEX_004435 [Taenia solium]|eukprot:TsM_001005900 transcript=TsM_001005900 gene=TsM_001005900